MWYWFIFYVETLQRSNVRVEIWDAVSKRLLSNMGADVLENGVMCDDFLRVLMAGSKCCYRTKQELLEVSIHDFPSVSTFTVATAQYFNDANARFGD